MSKLIDGERFQKKLFRFADRLDAWKLPEQAKAVRAVAKGIKLEKTVDAVEVVHGVWEDIYGGKYANPKFRCSVCKNKALYTSHSNCLGTWVDVQDLSNYCPNCGAKMDGDGNA